MKRFKNILVYFDTSSKIPQTALDSAIELARVSGARITVMDVLQEHSWQAPPAINTWKDIASILRSEMRDRLDEVVHIGRKNGVDLSAVLAEGLPFVEIIREVARNGHDIVYKTAMGEGTRTGRIFGNTAMRLMRKCPCPVMLIKPGHTTKIHHVVAAINTLVADSVHNDLNKKIVELADSLACLSDAEFSIIQAWEAPGETILAGRWSESAVQQHVRECEKSAQDNLDRVSLFCGQMADPARIHLRKGPPHHVLPRFVEEKNASMLVMGSVARTGLPGLFVGNTAELTFDQVDCSVLTLKPEEFISPITI